MIENFQLLRNIGQFDSVDSGSRIDLAKLSLIYGENGRGKTTLAAVLRSLGTGDGQPILERARLGSTNPPHVVLKKDGGTAVFSNGGWSNTPHNVVIFDDVFVANNVCSGIEIDAIHRQNLHELILGAQGVELNKRVQVSVARIEEHNKAIRSREEAIPVAIRGGKTVPQFCKISPDQKIAEKLKEAQQRLAAAKSTEQILKQPQFITITLPEFRLSELNQILGRSLPDLESESLNLVRAHFRKLGSRGEAWVSEGMALPRLSDAGEHCPFCQQSLEKVEILQLYQAYFSQAYISLQKDIEAMGRGIRSIHDEGALAGFERSVRGAVEGCTFWAQFIDINPFAIDTAELVRAWQAAREAVLSHLRAKLASPLEEMKLPESTVSQIEAYEALRSQAVGNFNALLEYNEKIGGLKERAAINDLQPAEAHFAELKVVQGRSDPAIIIKCDDYQKEVDAKRATEKTREEARQDLDDYRASIFSNYGRSINKHLADLNAGFHIGTIESANHRGGSSAVYNVVINNTPVDVSSSTGAAFRNTLSAGDRSTLALAFFFSSLEMTSDLASTIVVIDDPMTSLDDYRTRATISKIIGLLDKTEQVIVLSHSRRFLCQVWERAKGKYSCALRLLRGGAGSLLAVWNVKDDGLTEHDKHFDLVTNYVRGADPDKERQVARALRPMVEAYLRVAYADRYPPETLLGEFTRDCRRYQGGSSEILSSTRVTMLSDIVDYANKFHHDTNAAYETEFISDTELSLYCRRVIEFIRN